MPTRYKPEVWYQVGGDVNPIDHGGTIARDCGNGWTEVREIMSTREGGDRAAREAGFPLMSFVLITTVPDMERFLADPSARRCMDLDSAGEMFEPGGRWTRERRLHVAAEMARYGSTESGPCGWAGDVVPRRVSWWARGNTLRGWRKADTEFRREVLKAD